MSDSLRQTNDLASTIGSATTGLSDGGNVGGDDPKRSAEATDCEPGAAQAQSTSVASILSGGSLGNALGDLKVSTPFKAARREVWGALRSMANIAISLSDELVDIVDIRARLKKSASARTILSPEAPRPGSRSASQAEGTARSGRGTPSPPDVSQANGKRGAATPPASSTSKVSASEPRSGGVVVAGSGLLYADQQPSDKDSEHAAEDFEAFGSGVRVASGSETTSYPATAPIGSPLMSVPGATAGGAGRNLGQPASAELSERSASAAPATKAVAQDGSPTLTTSEQAALDRLRIAALGAGVSAEALVEALLKREPATAAPNEDTVALVSEVRELCNRLANDVPTQLARRIDIALREARPRYTFDPSQVVHGAAPVAGGSHTGLVQVSSDVASKEVGNYRTKRRKAID